MQKGCAMQLNGITLKWDFFTDVHVGRLIAYSIAIVQFPTIIFTGNISIKSSEESVFLQLLDEKSKSIDIDSNVNLVINEEDRGENFTVRIGEINPKDKEEEQQQLNQDNHCGGKTWVCEI